ncbi:hypothetical protein NLC29_00890 [Candidatus Aminicenantes bacterium AH-873-B07]|jgi:hypothetical protein|nr:hypothetical protein [Candidatus Aminicenantes bacterium AH-873-B07]
MKRKIFTIFTVCLILIFSTYCKKVVKEGREEILRILPKESTGIIFLNIEKISHAEFFKKLTSKEKKKIENWGIDPEKDIHFIGIAIFGKTVPGKKAEGVMVMHLNYKRDLILSNLKKEGLNITIENYENVPLISGIDRKNKNLKMTFINDNLMGIGNEKVLKKVIDLRKGKGENIFKNSQLMNLIKDINQESFLWGGFLIPKKGLKEVLAKNPQAKIFESIKAISFFMDYNNVRYQGELNLHNDNEAQNKQMADFLNGIKAMISMGKGQDPDVQELLNGIKISAEAMGIKFTINLAEDLIMRLKQKSEKKKK